MCARCKTHAFNFMDTLNVVANSTSDNEGEVVQCYTHAIGVLHHTVPQCMWCSCPHHIVLHNTHAVWQTYLDILNRGPVAWTPRHILAVNISAEKHIQLSN